MIMCATTDGPPWGYCRCGWPLFRDGSCSDAECSYGWISDDPDEEDSELIDDDIQRLRVIGEAEDYFTNTNFAHEEQCNNE